MARKPKKKQPDNYPAGSTDTLSQTDAISKAPPYPNQMPGPAMAKMMKDKFGIK